MISSAVNNHTSDYSQDEFEIEEEFVCSICLDLMHQPVTTPCGHTFCKQCMKDALKIKPECTTCRTPLGETFRERMPTNITLQSLIERKYPSQHKKKMERVAKELNQRVEALNLFEGLPVIICKSYIYPGMKTLMQIDTRQLKDMVHYVTSSERRHETVRRFIIVREHADMRGFRMILRQVIRQDNRIIAEIVGDSRVVIDSLYIPPERAGIYSNQAETMQFGRGRIISDDSPYEQVTQEVRNRILVDRESRDEIESRSRFEAELATAKRRHYEEINT